MRYTAEIETEGFNMSLILTARNGAKIEIDPAQVADVWGYPDKGVTTLNLENAEGYHIAFHDVRESFEEVMALFSAAKEKGGGVA